MKSDKDPLTHHGRPLGDTTQEKRPPLQRSNSVRRMDRSVLESIAKTSMDKAEGKLATRELQVRKEMELISQLQTSAKPTQIAATKPISARGVDALRYSQSLAEEAHDRANAGKFPVFGSKTTPEVIGVSENRGRIGVGFSGDKEAYPIGGGLLAKGMLELQEEYAGKNGQWSGRLKSIPFEPTISESSLVGKRTICAATRSTAATFPELGKEKTELHRETFSEREALIEAQSTSFTGKKLKYPHHSIDAHMTTIGSKTEEDPSPMLKRTHSLQNLMESCDVCKREFQELEGKRK